MLRPRAGLTLLEVLVVLAIVAITASVVPVAWRGLPSTGSRDPQLFPHEFHGVVQQARREAIRRGESLLLRADADGAWVLITTQGTRTIAEGRVTGTTPSRRLRIDALGTCQSIGPSDGASEGASRGANDGATDGSRDFDMLTCRNVGEQP